MAENVSSMQDISSLAESIRKQLDEGCTLEPKPVDRESFQDFDSQFTVMHDNLLALLDLLEKQESPPHPAPPLPFLHEPAESPSLLSVVDTSMARWQAQISTAYGQVAAQQLSDQLKLAELLTESLRERECQLEQHRQSLERKTADVLRWHARLTRQRKEIARLLRAKKAELLLDVELRRITIYEEIRNEVAGNSQLPLLLLRQGDARELQELELKFKDTCEQLQLAHNKIAKLETKRFIGLTESVSGDLQEAQELLREMERNEAEQRVRHGELVAELECQVLRYQEELERVQRQLAESLAASASPDRSSDVESQLIETRRELEDLREQNFDLAAQIAKYQVISTGHTPHVSFDQQSLSWEERKKLIMQQLESESADAIPATGGGKTQRLAMEQLLATTEMEIRRRDREIEELQSIVEQQSNTAQGVAIGAAAIAQLLDTDELIQQERQKLKDIQQEWEEKLRRTEIDLSLERAKLSRERSQMENELEQTKRDLPPPAEPEDGQPKKRRWLEHLGLKDDSREK